jgi:hypothetical protein
LQHVGKFGLATFDDFSDKVPFVGDIVINVPFYDPDRLIPLVFTHFNTLVCRWFAVASINHQSIISKMFTICLSFTSVGTLYSLYKVKGADYF